MGKRSDEITGEKMEETRTNEFNTGDQARDRSRARTIDDPTAENTTEVIDRANTAELSRSTEAVTDFEVAANRPAGPVLERMPETERTTASPPGGWKSGDNDVDATRAEIERTRADMSQTVDQIQEKLDPQLLMDQAKERASEFAQQTKESIKEATVGKAQQAVGSAVDSTKEFMNDAGHAVRDVGESALDTLQENPIPFAAAGLGLGWLLWRFFGRRTPEHRFRHGVYVYRGRVYDFVNPADDRPGPSSFSSGPARGYAGHPEPAGEFAARADGGDLKDRAGQLAGRMQEKTGHVVNQVQDRAGRLADQVQDQASQLTRGAQDQFRQASSGFQRMLDDNPLAVGAIALAVGVAIGLAIPETEQENRLMGETRDQLVETAQQTAQNVAQNVTHKVQNVASEAVNAAKEEAQKEGLAPTA